ncbi:beta-lactamase [Acetobacter senegalensis]|uniref:Beta-lactamase n=2 Tax=Acetobacter senegalensis TaxID=446692 RepID=A0A0U5B6W4_9PROT|nr:beta-lactamase [Acetobacter senegalensis]
MGIIRKTGHRISLKQIASGFGAAVFLFALPVMCLAEPNMAATLMQDSPLLMKKAGIPGLSIAVIHNNAIQWTHEFGVADKEKNTPVTAQTLFSAASLSKPVFAYIVLQLSDEGKIDLDTPLFQYWPNEITDDPRLKSITARIVLSHRTGFPDWRPHGGQLKIHFQPGERFSYSGEGYVYLQKVIEYIEKKPLADSAQDRVFGPLQMVHSTFFSHTVPETAKGYDDTGAPHDPFESTGNAAYSLQTTAEDYALFLKAVLDGKGLKPATLRMMESPQSTLTMLCTYCTDQPPAPPSSTLFWGLGWGIERIGGHSYLWHWGDNIFYKAFVAMDLQHHDAMVYFTNSQNGLAIAPSLLKETLGINPLSLKWLGYTMLTP